MKNQKTADVEAVSMEILIVDDDPHDLKLLQTVLQDNGFVVRAAKTHDLAARSAQHYPPDLILLDIQMPGKSGFDIAQDLRNETGTEAIPIIFLTAESQRHFKLEGFKQGAVDYITKPFDPDELLARLQAHGKTIRQETFLRQKQRELEQKLKEFSVFSEPRDLEAKQNEVDFLTGLLGRRGFLEAHHYQFYQPAPFVLGVVNIDRTSLINDTYGLDVGDAAIVYVADLLRAALPLESLLSRMTGDEFAFTVAADTDLAALAAGILGPLQDESVLRQVNVPLSLSLAFSRPSGHYPDNTAMIREVRLTLQKLKQQGGAEFAVACGTDVPAYDTRRLEMDLRSLLKENQVHTQTQLFLRYQPIVSLASTRIVSFEVLVAWEHPEFGMVSPLVFIPIAEQSGLIHKLGQWITDTCLAEFQALRQVCAPLKTVNLNINVSILQLNALKFQADFLDSLSRYGLPPKCVTLELTESANIEVLENYKGILSQLRYQGFSLALDDFGTGYSSLSQLHNLPLSSIKIDKSFVQNLGTSTSAEEIIKLLISVAHQMGIKTVAEGIETQDQEYALREMGCDEGQGYHFSKPVLRHQIVEFFAES
jgi:diguanylate cyclase (GGDEF)-like protein